MDSDNQQLKVLPNSKESEMIILGCMLIKDDSLKLGAEALSVDDFFYPQHKSIFLRLKSIYKAGKPADVHLVCVELKREDMLKSVGGKAYIANLAQYAGTSAHVEAYIEELKSFRAQREIIRVAEQMQTNALNLDDPSKILLECREKLKNIEKHRSLSDKFPIRFLNEFENNFLLSPPPKKPMLLEYANDEGILTGFLPRGIVGMLVGAGGVGKTHLLAQLAIAISTGTSWLETYSTSIHYGTSKKGNVFFGLGENQYEDIHRILYKASKKLREHQPDIFEVDPLIEASKRIAAFSFCGQHAAFLDNKKPSKYFYEFKTRLIEKAPKDGWDLIILDPISRLMGADAETDNAAATQFIALLEELTIDLQGNPTILFAHHVNKAAIKPTPAETTTGPTNQSRSPSTNASQADSRGSSAITDGVRWQLNLRSSEKGTVILEMTKTNFTAPAGKITLRKEYDGYLSKEKLITRLNGNGEVIIADTSTLLS